MSRIRAALDGVTRVVGSTDLISKFSRLKTSSAPSGTKVENLVVRADAASDSTTPEAAMTKEEEGEKPAGEDGSDERQHGAPEKTADVSGPGTSSTVAKQTMQLFHPAALSTSMDETYNTLAQHVNSYFGTSARGEDGDSRPQEQRRGKDELIPTPASQTGGHVPVLSPAAQAKSTEAPTSPPADTPNTSKPSSSPKKGFTRYLSYPRPSVQAFVGSYIAPLVPKFRGDSKSLADAKNESSSAVAVDEAEKKDGEEQEADEVKQQLLIQREKV